jgi:iron complex outermembrane receptor protein
MKRILAASLPVFLMAAAPSMLSAQDCAGMCPLDLGPIEARATRSQFGAGRVPFATTSLSAQAIALSAATSAAEALRGVPGVQVANRYNDAVGERITIRGMGARAQFGIRGIRVLVDGIPATMPDGQTTLTHLDASEVTGTQVLRGPAGSLWGNASGGVVQLTTMFDHRTRGISAKADAGGFGLRRASLSGFTSTGRTYGADFFGRVTSQHFTGFRANSSSSKLLASGATSWRDSTNRVWLTAHAVRYDAENPGSLSQTQLDSARFQANPNNVRQKTGEHGTHLEAGTGWTHWMNGSLFEVSAYGIYRDLTNPIPPTIIDLSRNAAGVRAVFNSPQLARIGITTGAEAAVQSDDRLNHVNTLGTRGATTLDQSENVAYIAPFMQVLAGITRDIDALVAVRYDAYRFRAHDHLVNAGDPDDSGTRTMTSPSVTGGVRARFGGASVYGNYATSFQTPTTTELANRPDGAGGFNPTLNPERTHGGEVGATYRAGELQIEGAAYIARVRNSLIGFEVPSAPSRQFFRNAGAVTNKGVEAGASYRTKYVQLRGSASTKDSRFDEYVAGGVDYADKRVPGVARVSGDASLTLMPWEMTWLRIDARHSGAVFANDANTSRAPAFTLIDAGVSSWGYRLGSTDLMLTAGVSNITDRAHITSVSINAAGARYFEPGPGRALFLTLTVAH